MKESDLYEPVKQYFSDLGYAIYAEVVVKYCGGRIDVVAYNHPAAIAIELKQSLTFDLIEQALARKAVFPLIYIAYPAKKKRPNVWLMNYLQLHGIGTIEVTEDGRAICVERARYRKPYFQHKTIDFRKILRPEHQEWVPGGHAGGGYVTDYAITMKGVKNYLYRSQLAGKHRECISENDSGWRSVKDILEFCETHYATPRNSLGLALQRFEHDWCEVKKEGGRLYYRYKAEGSGKS